MLRFATLLVSVLAVLVVLPAAPALAHGSFWDDDGHIHEPSIQAVADEDVTHGCNDLGDRYCPGEAVRRGQMAAFLDRALDLPATDQDHFTDDDSPFEAAINRVAEAGIARGCEPDRFCPRGTVDRAQMATFLVEAFDFPPSDTNHFTDDDGTTHEDEINALAEQGVTEGCNSDGTQYCPDDPVQRGAMATFLARALDLAVSDPTTGDELVLTYTLGREGNPDAGSFAIFGTRVHQALHGDPGWNIQGRILFRHVESGGDFHIWLTDDDNVGDKAPVCSDEWSCTVGDDVYINDENFSNPPSHWGDRLPAYQRYVINHEVGHYLDFDERTHYNDSAYCDPAYSGDAPVMMQQSKPTVMNGNNCDLNVWPLGFERDCVEEAMAIPDETTQSEECPHQP